MRRAFGAPRCSCVRPVGGCEHSRFLDSRALAHAHLTRCEPSLANSRLLLRVTDQGKPRSRMRDRAQHRPVAAAVVALERDERAEEKAVGDEGARAVDRIEHPAIARHSISRGALAELLAQHSVRRIAVLDERAHRLLGAAIGCGHGRGVVLGIDRDAAEEQRPDDRDRRTDQLVHERHELARFARVERRAVSDGGVHTLSAPRTNSASQALRSASPWGKRAHAGATCARSRASAASCLPAAFHLPSRLLMRVKRRAVAAEERVVGRDFGDHRLGRLLDARGVLAARTPRDNRCSSPPIAGASPDPARSRTPCPPSRWPPPCRRGAGVRGQAEHVVVGRVRALELGR